MEAFLKTLFGEAIAPDRQLGVFTLPDKRAQHFTSLEAAALHAASDGTGSGGDGSGSDGSDGGRTPKQPGDGPQDARDWDFSFDTGGGTAKIFVFRTKSVNGGFPVTTTRTLWKGPGNANKADYGGAINVRQRRKKGRSIQRWEMVANGKIKA